MKDVEGRSGVFWTTPPRVREGVRSPWLPPSLHADSHGRKVEGLFAVRLLRARIGGAVCFRFWDLKQPFKRSSNRNFSRFLASGRSEWSIYFGCPM